MEREIQALHQAVPAVAFGQKTYVRCPRAPRGYSIGRPLGRVSCFQFSSIGRAAGVDRLQSRTAERLAGDDASFLDLLQ